MDARADDAPEMPPADGAAPAAEAAPADEAAEPAPEAGGPHFAVARRTPAETCATLMALGFLVRAGDRQATFRFAA